MDNQPQTVSITIQHGTQKWSQGANVPYRPRRHEDEEVIKKILKHLGLWEVKARPPPKVKAPSPTIYLDDSESQILSPDSFYAHPDYPMDSYVS